MPSGVWAETEYVKLPQYDREMHEQPFEMFDCHQQDGKLCAGWLGCHGADNLISVRIGMAFGRVDIPAVMDFVSPVPLFASGAEAAIHGLEDIRRPGRAAKTAIRKLLVKRGIDPESA